LWLGEFEKRIKIVCTEVGFDDHFKQLTRIVAEAKKEFPNFEDKKYEGLQHSTWEWWGQDVKKWFERWFGGEK